MNYSFNNKYSWQVFAVSFLLFLVMTVVFVSSRLYIGTLSNYLLFLHIICCVGVFVGPIWNVCKNEYVVSTDVLTIKEYSFFRRALCVDIELKHIQSAEIVWSWYRLHKVVRIHMLNDQIDILSISNREGLVKKLNNLCA